MHLRPVSTFSGAHEALCANKQRKSESLNTYAARMKSLLQSLNSSGDIADKEVGIRNALRSQNEKTAITKFTQGILNAELQRQVSSIAKETLDEQIAIALEKSQFLIGSSLLQCNFCKKHHFEYECKMDDEKKSKDNNTNIKTLFCVRCKKNNHSAEFCYSRTYQVRPGANGPPNNQQNNNSKSNSNWNKSNGGQKKKPWNGNGANASQSQSYQRNNTQNNQSGGQMPSTSQSFGQRPQTSNVNFGQGQMKNIQSLEPAVPPKNEVTGMQTDTNTTCIPFLTI